MSQKLKFLTDTSETNAISIKYCDITDIKFLPDNIKAHDIEAIITNISRYGFVDPILINSNTIHNLDGNGTLEALLLMRERRVVDPDNNPVPKGIIERKLDAGGRYGDKAKGRPVNTVWYAPIIDLAFTEMDELTLAISLNRIQEQGGVDPIKAFPVLKRLLDAQTGDFEKTGYDLAALEHLQRLHKFAKEIQEFKDAPAPTAETGEKVTDVSDPDFAAKLNEKWEVSLGDLWQIGNHRLMCGSSTDEIAFTQLNPADERIRLVFTSPPYDNQRSYETDGFDWTNLMSGVSLILSKYVEAPADIVINLGSQYKDGKASFYWNEWLEYCSRIEMPLYGLYIWDKGFGYPGEYHGRLATSHEYLFHFSLGHTKANKWIETTGATVKRGPNNFAKRKVDGSLRPGYTSPDSLGQSHKIPDSVVRLFNEQSRGIHTKGHPATFPVSLPEFMMNTWSKIGDIVYEPFCGSGTTIIAGQNLSRSVRAMEISPNYCALILERLSLAFPDLEIKKL